MKNMSVLMLTLLFGTSGAVSAASLRPWVGEYPSTKIRGRSASEVLMNRSFFKKIVPPSEIRLVKAFAVEDTISQDGDYILVSKCKPHDCPGNHLMIIEKLSGELWLGIYQSSEGYVSTRWYGATDFSELPLGIQKAFVRGHTPE